MHYPHVLITGRAGHGKDALGSHFVEHYGFSRAAFGDPIKAEILDAYRRAPEKLSLTFVNDRAVKEQPLTRLSLQYCEDRAFVALAERIFEPEDRATLAEVRSALALLKTTDLGKFTSLRLFGTTAQEILQGAHPRGFSLTVPRSFRRICQVWGTEHRRSQPGTDDYWVDQIDEIITAAQSPMVITDGRFRNEIAWGLRIGACRIDVRRPSMDGVKLLSTESGTSQWTSTMARWLRSPSSESLLSHISVKMTLTASTLQSHSSEMIPEADERTIVVVNDGSLDDLHHSGDHALQSFSRRARRTASP